MYTLSTSLQITLTSMCCSPQLFIFSGYHLHEALHGDDAIVMYGSIEPQGIDKP